MSLGNTMIPTSLVAPISDKVGGSIAVLCMEKLLSYFSLGTTTLWYTILRKNVSAKKVGTSLPFCYPVLNTRMLQLEKNDVHPKQRKNGIGPEITGQHIAACMDSSDVGSSYTYWTHFWVTGGFFLISALNHLITLKSVKFRLTLRFKWVRWCQCYWDNLMVPVRAFLT